MIQNIFTSILAFVSTNIDDIFLLTLFFSTRKFKAVNIFLGQYTGIATLVAISFVGSYIGNFIDQSYVGLLGLFPIYLAIKHIIDSRKGEADDNDEVNIKSRGILAIAGVTIANGGDNIGVYVPLLTTMSGAEKIQMVVVFLIMTYVWCVAGQYLASRPLIAKQLDKYGHVIVPFVLFMLGIFILFESGTFGLLTV